MAVGKYYMMNHDSGKLELSFIYEKFFSLRILYKAFSKMKSAQWGFSFNKSNIHFLKQLCLYFHYLMRTV